MRWPKYGHGKSRKRSGQMNKLESEYAQILDYMKHEGEILWWGYECWKFRLADNTWFTPDFIVMFKDGHLEARETKGFMFDDANVKLKVAAEIHPIPFVLIKQLPKKDGGGWEERTI